MTGRPDPAKLHELQIAHIAITGLRNTLADAVNDRYRLVEELIADGMSQGEIARHLGITTQAVGDLRRRGRSRQLNWNDKRPRP